MSPIAVVDKSSFQAISTREMVFFEKYFIHNLTPVLAVELLGDLSKRTKQGQSPEKAVSSLANKFFGSGPPINADYRTVCIGSLYGQRVPMDGRVLVDYARTVGNPDGTCGAIIDLHPINKAIMRWQQGFFNPDEKGLAELWRTVTHGFAYSSFRKQLDGLRIVVPCISSLTDFAVAVNDLSITAGLQDTWFGWLLDQLALPQALQIVLSDRWQYRSSFLLRDHAPFAYHCLKVMLSLHLAVRSKLIKWNPTHLIDMQYLYYLPFCYVFVSGDKLHEMLSPSLLRQDQRFIRGMELKSDLRRQAEFWESLPDDRRRRLSAVLGMHPVPMKGSLICDLYKQYCTPWSPRSGDLAVQLNAYEKDMAVKDVKQLTDEAGGE